MTRPRSVRARLLLLASLAAVAAFVALSNAAMLPAFGPTARGW